MQKPSKLTGILRIDRKIRAMENTLPNYGIFMSHIEPLYQNNSQALKRVEIKSVVRKWFHGKYPMHLAIFFSFLTPIQVFSLTMQYEVHEPVNILLTGSCTSYCIVILHTARELMSLSGPLESLKFSYFTKFLKEVTLANN